MTRKHWTEAVKAENDALKRQLDELRMQPYLAKFAKEVAGNIMLMLANKPFAQWPELCQHAFKHARDRQETIAYMYQQRLPK
jgi:hypothetical protein